MHLLRPRCAKLQRSTAVRTFLTRSRSAARTLQVETAPAAPPLPLIQTIQVGGKQLAGDMGFDPLDLADTPESLAWYREAEVKHARLAMLAAFGWPVSEVTNF